MKKYDDAKRAAGTLVSIHAVRKKAKRAAGTRWYFFHVVCKKAKRAAGTRWYLFTLFAQRQKEPPGRDGIYLRCSQKSKALKKRCRDALLLIYVVLKKATGTQKEPPGRDGICLRCSQKSKKKKQLFDKTKKLHRHRKRQQQQTSRQGRSPQNLNVNNILCKK